MLPRRQRFDGSCLKSLVVEFGRCSRCFREARLYSAPLAVAKSSDKIVFNCASSLYTVRAKRMVLTEGRRAFPAPRWRDGLPPWSPEPCVFVRARPGGERGFRRADDGHRSGGGKRFRLNVEQAHRGGGSNQGQSTAQGLGRHGVVIEIEADAKGFIGMHGAHQVAGKRGQS